MPAKFRYIVSAFVLLFAFLQYNCGSMPVYRLSPVNGKSVWDFGREVIGQEDYNGKVHLSFMEVKDGYFVFLINYENLTGHSVLLDPGKFYFEGFRDSIPKNSKGTLKHFAVDPELKLAGIEKSSNDLEASERTRLGFSFVSGAIDVVSSVASIGKKRSKEELEKEERLREERRIADENAKIDYENNVIKLDKAKDYWSNEVLRKVTVYNGEKVGGFFHLPVSRRSEFIRVIIPIEEHTYSFDYRQYEVKSFR